jgi:hypothetical protein
VGSLITSVSREAMKAAMARNGERGLSAQVRAYKDASEAVNLAADLAIAYSRGPKSGPWPTFEEAARIEDLPSERTFYRRLKTYREIFGPEADPYELAKVIWRDFSARLEEDGPAVAADLPASLLPLA